MVVCSVCKKEVEKYFIINRKMCKSCNNKEYYKNKKKETCSICCKLKKPAAHIDSKPVCSGCERKYFRIRKECCICHEYSRIEKREIYGLVCEKCYKVFCRKREECCCCQEIRPIEKNTENGPICKKCYKQPKKECCVCHENKTIKARGMCDNCDHKERRNNDEKYRIKCLLRERLNAAFKQFSVTGKVKHADEYGIDYEAIIKHLGPCPGNREDYHIDHIKPLCSFNFDDLEQIKLAFSPENHQWLLKIENLKKGSKL